MRVRLFRAVLVSLFLFLSALGTTHAQFETQPENETQTHAALDARAYAKLVASYQKRIPLWRLLHAVRRQSPTVDDGLDRARLRGLVPQVRLGGRFRKGNDFLQVQADDTGRLNLSSDQQLSVDLELRFALDKLVYDASEPTLQRARDARRQRQRVNRERIVTLYYEWLELSVQRDLVHQAPLSLHVAIGRVASELNIATDGLFFRIMRRASAF